MQKEASIAGAARTILGKARKVSHGVSAGIAKAYAPIKAISPVAIGGGLVAGHIMGGYSGSAAAQSNMYHLGYNDAVNKMNKQAGLISSIANRVRAARGFATASGNTASGVLGAMKNSLAQTSIGRSAISNASKVAKSPLGNRVSQGVRSATTWAKNNPGKTVATSALVGGAAGAGMAKQSSVLTDAPELIAKATRKPGVYHRAMSALQGAAKRHPVVAKVVGGATAFGAGLGATHFADEHLDGAMGQAAVYNFRKKNGSI